jgi:acyl carrier protein
VKQVVVVARQDVPGETRLVAYVVGQPDTTIEVGELRDHLRQFVPDYMVPSSIVVLDALPLTPNGKLDRRALPAPDGRQIGAGYVAPRTPVEEVLASIWAEVLQLDRVGITDNFFDLGGHSLLAMRVVARVRNSLSVELLLRELFEAPIIAKLGEMLSRRQRIEQLAQEDEDLKTEIAGLSLAEQAELFALQMRAKDSAPDSDGGQEIPLRSFCQAHTGDATGEVQKTLQF